MATVIEYGLVSALIGVVVITGVTSIGAHLKRENNFPYVSVALPPHEKPKEFIGWVCPDGTMPVQATGNLHPYACIAATPAEALWK